MAFHPVPVGDSVRRNVWRLLGKRVEQPDELVGPTRGGSRAASQLRPLREHTRTLADVEVVGEFVHRASADDLRGRRAWRQLLEAALKRDVDLIVVWRLDRAFRSVVDGATTLQTLRSAGCGIRSLQEPWIDTTTPIGEAMYHITIAWAQLEKRQLTERVKAGMERARAEGKNLGRPSRNRPVTEHPSWSKVLQALEAGHINRAEAAKKLHVRKAVLIEALASFPKGGPKNEGAAERAGTT